MGCLWRLLAILLIRICLVDASHIWPDKDELIREIDEEYSRSLKSKTGKKGSTPQPSSSFSPTMTVQPTGGKKAFSPTTVIGGKKGLDGGKKTMTPSLSDYPTKVGGKKGSDSGKKTMAPSMSAYPTMIGGKKGLDGGKKTMAPSLSAYPTMIGGKKAAKPANNFNLGPSPLLVPVPSTDVPDTTQPVPATPAPVSATPAPVPDTPAPVPDTPQPAAPVAPTLPNIDTSSPSQGPSSVPSLLPSSQPSVEPSSSAPNPTTPDLSVSAQQYDEHHRAPRHPGKRLPEEHHYHHHGDEQNTT